MTRQITWDEVLAEEHQQPYYQDIMSHINRESAKKTIYPPMDHVFSAFKHTPFENVKVVIIGQDPYHGPKQAHGLCFSVKLGVTPPPSLKNIYKELMNDIKMPMPSHGNLESWAKQGVFLLNSVLTVEASKPQSHSKIGWQRFTDAVIMSLNNHPNNLVFMLWGAYAQKKGRNIDQNRHLVLSAPHPSPLSAHRGFLGCRHFSTANQWLSKQGLSPIDWTI